MKKHSMALNRKRQVAALNPKRGNSYVYKKSFPNFYAQETLSLDEKTAATYSPTGVQYHRRGRA